ncbi:hypothetical protein IIE18_10910 [Pseudomonas sp. V1]|uniref:hypothetical protein n=1 Tax=Pseudomonas arcuscaelestis TaxID=2710591 RepID=UPI00193ED484|nr:hypothetical protein [Pseudomonas arcuscaelestis]MBM3105649.1 hypothetical protein [Pseudomonas arcuscaelestis]
MQSRTIQRLAMLAGFAATIVAIVGAVQYLGSGTPAEAPANDAETKSAIQARYLASPSTFDLPAAASDLAAATMEGGYHVCTLQAEITAEQYVDISRMLDQPRPHADAFRAVVDRALDTPEGVADCTYRVLVLLDRVAS